ncbi:sialidase family protein [Sphingomonas canadensis]|uniref:Sialidase family protein n=1 Tax=Sphingomonas canadensis TaxID=1219257 RepID=A0ABW3H3N4_9SPHN|nr:sialidase family protein [Sphingomonas canadensis]MCW3835609.1 glycoside hydrolase [Sphingomonas canadensis]
MTKGFDRPRPADSAEHGIVYRNEGEFCGWPFYCGLWQTADGGFAAGFKRIPCDYGAYGDVDHNKLTRNMGKIWVIRSADGRSWDPESFVEIIDMNVQDEKDLPGGGAADWSGLPPLDFDSRDTLIMSGGLPRLFAPGGQAWMRASTDGGRTWRPAAILPRYELPALSGFGSSMYSTRADGIHLLGLNTMMPDSRSPRPLVYGSADGNNWYFLSFVTPEMPRSPYYPGGSPFAPAPHFYPRLIVLRDGRVISTLRYQRDPRNAIWTDVYESLDGGRTWDFLSRVNDWGSPGDIVELSDGRIVCVYGYRVPPAMGVRARVSEDGGRTWGSEIILRGDGGSWDLGYPRVIECAPGEILAIYYMNLASDPVQVNGGVRHIAWTRWRP